MIFQSDHGVSINTLRFENGQPMGDGPFEVLPNGTHTLDLLDEVHVTCVASGALTVLADAACKVDAIGDAHDAVMRPGEKRDFPVVAGTVLVIKAIS